MLLIVLKFQLLILSPRKVSLFAALDGYLFDAKLVTAGRFIFDQLPSYQFPKVYISR